MKVFQTQGTPTAATIDTTDCDLEPIHVPGSIQPHGILVVLSEPDLLIQHISENCETLLGIAVDHVLGEPLDALLGSEAREQLTPLLVRAKRNERPAYLRCLSLERDRHDSRLCLLAVAHRTEAGIVLELEIVDHEENPDDFHPRIDHFTIDAESAMSIGELSRLTAEEVRLLTGFDRVLIYRFDEQWNGKVTGEAGNGKLPELLDHRFPASDIPAQARELYRSNRIRIIPDSSYRPVPIVPGLDPITGKPLDLSFSTLRSVSPVHVEYMKNMETRSSMSISILRKGKLWGLIACHHREPLTIPFLDRGVCDLFARIFSIRLSALEHQEDYERRIEVRSTYARLLALMADRGDFATALGERPNELLSFANAEGAAVLNEGECQLYGKTPTEEQVRSLADWLSQTVADEVYHTDSLVASYPQGAAFKDKVSGFLAVSISKRKPDYLLWFRPEVIQTVKWSGDPNKPVERIGNQIRLHPRSSFATWREQVREKSLPWQPSELEAAAELRNAIVGIVLRKAEELAELNSELTRSNRELESFSYSVSHDLRAPLRHIVGYAEMVKENAEGKLSELDRRCIGTIIESSEYAGKLVDKLLSFSRLGRSELQCISIDMNLLVQETIRDVMRDAESRKVEWKVDSLPIVYGDLMMIRMAVRDLFSNALKYTRNKEETLIEVTSVEDGSEYVFSVKDNGVGFDMEYADKLFGVFQRLHRWEEYEGTGIGLANVRRVMERHGGRTWAFGEENQGANFFFTLPKTQEESQSIRRRENQ